MAPENELPKTRLSLTVEAEAIEDFCLLTGGGFNIRVRTGESVRQVLCGQLGIEPSYFDDRIATIFLDSSAVDDPDKAIVTAGSTVALSAAMPGVAGAMLRSGGHYSPMRSAISHDGSSQEGGIAASVQPEETEITLKLFNMLQRELGPGFLSRGFGLPGRAFADLLSRRGRKFRSAVRSVEVDGKKVDVGELFDVDWSARRIDLRVAGAEK